MADLACLVAVDICYAWTIVHVQAAKEMLHSSSVAVSALELE